MFLEETKLSFPNRCNSETSCEQENADMKKEHSHRLSMNNTDDLNVTDYINELLTKRNSGNYLITLHKTYLLYFIKTRINLMRIPLLDKHFEILEHCFFHNCK